MVPSLLIGAISLVALAITPVFALLVISCALFGNGAGLLATPRVTSLQAYPVNDGTVLGVVLAVGSVAEIIAPLAAGRFAAKVDRAALPRSPCHSYLKSRPCSWNAR